MQAYMISKRFSRYPGATQAAPQRFLGVTSPKRKSAIKEALGQHPLETAEHWRTAIRALWDGMKAREEGYAAIDILLGPARHRRYYTPTLFDQLDEMVVTGAWWDFVDPLATAYGSLLARNPDIIRPRILAYAVDPDLWRRRIAILCQLKARDATDVELLTACILPNRETGEFFLDKAIGWSLRTYARHDPSFVRRFVNEHAARLAPLAKREATKHLP